MRIRKARTTQAIQPIKLLFCYVTIKDDVVDGHSQRRVTADLFDVSWIFSCQTRKCRRRIGARYAHVVLIRFAIIQVLIRKLFRYRGDILVSRAAHAQMIHLAEWILTRLEWIMHFRRIVAPTSGTLITIWITIFLQLWDWIYFDLWQFWSFFSLVII